ncbi:MAG TPA: tetratricopeptide repeat protein [Candidatus Eisenbacteria bacterium]|jgi:tetratricopeptide (TPR) repeat protein
MRLTRAHAALIAALAAFALFAPTLAYDFVWDDRATVLHNQDIRSFRRLPAVFAGHAFAGAAMRDIDVIEYYRPAWVLSLAVDHALWGERALGYHLTNVLLHALAAGLVAWLVFELGAGAGVAALAGALFAVHPVHAEAVAWVSARNELLLGVFVMLAFIAHLHLRRGGGARAAALCLASFGLALLSKETAVLFPAVVLAYEWTHRERGTGKSATQEWMGFRARALWIALLAAVAVAFMAFRASIVKPLPVHDPLPTRLATAPGLVVENLRLLFVPIGLKVLHAIEPVRSPLAPAAVLPAAVLVAALVLVAWALRRGGSLGLGLAWILLGLAPVSGVAVLLQPAPLAERYLYLPSVGWALVVGALLARAGSRRSGALARAAPVVALAALPVFAAVTVAHMRPWRDELALASRMVFDAPGSPLAHSTLGYAWYRLERWPEAATEFATAARLRPADPWSHFYLGDALLRQGRLEPAERAFRSAIGLGMRYAPAHLGLARALDPQGRLEVAERECRAAIVLDSSLADAHSALGQVLYREGRMPEAERAYREALGLQPEDARTRSNLGALFMTANRWNEAVLELERARSLDPRLPEAQLNLGAALFQTRRLAEAEQALRAGLALRPGAAAARLMLGHALIAEGKSEEAAAELREVVRTAADSSLRGDAARALAGIERRR